MFSSEVMEGRGEEWRARLEGDGGKCRGALGKDKARKRAGKGHVKEAVKWEIKVGRKQARKEERL